MTTPSSFRPTDAALAEYLAGTLSGAELESIETWLGQMPERRVELDALRQVLAGPAPEPVSLSLGAELRARSEQPTAAAPKAWSRSTPLAWMGRGVVAMALAGGVIGLWHLLPASNPSGAAASASRVFRTANGQYATVTLPDSSRVTLGPATTLAVVAGFGDATRMVTMTGEASFTVDRDARAPFVVRAGSAVVQVLGTTFMVRHYASDHAVRVAVTNGRVSLRVHRQGVGEAILSAATVGVALDSGQIVVTPGTADVSMDWRDGTLHFRDTPLRDVLGDLGRAYDVDLTAVDTTLAAQLVTITVSTMRESLPQVLDGLMLSLGAHYTRSGRTITIHPGRVSAARKFLSPHLTREHTYGR